MRRMLLVLVFAIGTLASACRPAGGPPSSPDASAIQVQRAVPAPSPDRPTMAGASNRLGWQLLSRLPAQERHMIAPLSLSRALLRRAIALGPEAASVAERAFGGRDLPELLRAADALELSFVKEARTSAMRLDVVSAPADAMQSALTELSFEGHWQQRFEKDRTRARTFTSSAGVSREIPFMVQSARLPYAESESYRLLELPFRHERFSMLIWRPQPPLGLAELVALIAETGGELGIDRLAPRPVELELPRFKLKDERSLTETLRAIGLSAALDWAQRLELAVDEDGGDGEGTRAPVVGARVIAEPTLPIAIDGPFAFAVRDRPSGAMILIGAVADLQP